MCLGAASAKDRIDCVVRNAIKAGDIPGPRYLPNAQKWRLEVVRSFPASRGS
jgi:hypothetical protein